MRRVVSTLATLALVAACSGQPTATPVPTPPPTAEAQLLAAAAPVATPTPRPAPTPIPTAAPTPTATPRPEPIDRTMRRYGKRLAWRWLDPREFRCQDADGCWGLLVRARAACTKALDVRVAVSDSNGRRIDTLTRRRKGVRKGQAFRIILGAPRPAAQTASLARMRCLQKPKPKPRPRPRPGPPARQGCDPSYPTVCIRPYPPDLDCGQIPHRGFRVRGPDRHGFDGDRDGIGCES